MTSMIRSEGTDGVATRDRILREASRLFAVRGYYGGSTRNIAAAVGIRQPSLFHHFANKQAIFQELLTYSLDDSAVAAEYLARADGSAPARLYRFLVEDFRYLMDSPYDLRSIFNSDVLLDVDFKPWRDTAEKLHVAVTDMIQQGIDSDDFIDIEVSFARQAVSGLMLETIRERSLGEQLPTERPTRTAEFVLRALLIDASQLAKVAVDAFNIQGVPAYRDSAASEIDSDHR
jgi:AcrR family transcriptional regulator